jgi:septal ring factor EnvC (AmiA/AmiB activator)
MNAYIKIIAFIICCIPLFMGAQSNERVKLEKERKKLEKEISYIQKLLNENKGNKSATIGALKTIERKIYKRERLIKTIVREIKLLDKQIKQKKEIVHALELDLTNIKKEYAAMVVKAYQYQNSYNKLLFIFNSKDFNDLYTRLKYLDKYAEYRKQQAMLVKDTQQDIEKRVNTLNEKRQEKRSLFNNYTDQKQNLKSEVNSKNNILSSLKNKESKLKKQLNNKRERDKKLKKKIKDLIEKEILAKKGIDMKLSAEFKNNKGKLPWPTKGIVISKFGKHKHPLYDIYENNNGIDIKSTKGSDVKAIFKGKVSNIIFSPAFQNAVLVNHGEYFTVYSNIEEVKVKKDQIIMTGESIGTVYTDIENSKTEVHLEIWMGTESKTSTMNPELWLKKQSF